MEEPEWTKAGVVLGQPDEAKIHPPGTVIVLASETGRYTEFSICLGRLILPPRTALKWVLGSDIAESRNQGIGAFEGDWVWFIDDDHAFHAETLVYLLDREVDIVTPNVLRRQSPFLPVSTGLDGNFLDLRARQPEEMVEVLQAGSSGMLIRRPVIEALSSPWFELGDREAAGNRVSEDVYFCRKAREAGFKIHVDLSVPMGHFTVGSLWPAWNEEKEAWSTAVSVSNNGATLWIEPGEIPVPEADPAPS